jgi:hypothetical protein
MKKNGLSGRDIVGIVEEVEVLGRDRVRTLAVFDSGAKMTSIDVRLAARAKLGPIVRTTKIRNPSLKAEVRRPVVETGIRIRGRVFEALANIQDREHMTFPVIIGRNIISGNFIIDTKKNLDIYERERHARGKQAEV